MNNIPNFFVNLCASLESFLEIYFQQLQHEFKDQEQIAQQSATIEKPTPFSF